MSDMELIFPTVLSDQTKTQLIRCNEMTNKFGLVLTVKQMDHLSAHRIETLKSTGRIEFGEGILGKLIHAFCDSAYINQACYEETLIKLQELFYLFKNECGDLITDDELIEAMRLIYNEVARGSIDFISGIEWETMCHVARTGSLAGTGLIRPALEGAFGYDEYE